MKGKTKKKGKTINGRAKGHSFERWVAQEFRKVFPGAKRHLEYQADEAQGIDLDCTGDYRVQCKRGRKYAPLTKLNEIQLCPIEGGIPVLVTQGDHTLPMAALPLKDFLTMLRKLHCK